MKIQDKATSVLQRTAHLLRAQKSSSRQAAAEVSEPIWFRVIAQNPPTQNFAYKAHNLEKYQEKSAAENSPSLEAHPQTGFYKTRNYIKRSTNPRHLFTPHSIDYFEDKIRALFYEQHPWELARPKLVVETDGKDSLRTDWSKLDQISKRLDGESVVQRTLYLLENDPKYKETDSWLPAYDKARLEYYRLRIRQDTRTQVAMEEATMFGAVFGKSELQKGFEKEEQYIEKWNKEAVEETKIRMARMATPGGAAAASE
ncbi:mitochondrial 37S ribosomal protein mS23 [Magnusiomyces paraingens]|uniref:37S ribosomal protein S25, mitochondrial n=1 Tax=Magnusiomyces paraingens TaxID=2606893 RepID=A0A5E8C5F7_9ASCO|nr:uncharacterized protein SAPINGB_P006306 [Saprochaete ingens]VVT58632.1 unnamed protein product [Saprochaete ingens]